MKKLITTLFLFSFAFAIPSQSAEGIKATCSCPDEYPLMDTSGYCHSCDDTDNIHLSDKDSCEYICNGENGRTKRINDFFGCKLDGCPADMPLQDAFGRCKSCQYDGPVSDTEHCSLCSNRIIQDEKCIISDCSNRPLLSHDGYCYPCTTELDVEVLSGQCSSICPNRREQGSWSFGDETGETSGVFCSLKTDNSF